MRVDLKQRYVVASKDDPLSSLESVDSSICWAVGVRQLLKSTDAGRTWTNLYCSSPLFTNGLHAKEVAFSTVSDGLLLAPTLGFAGRVYLETTDGGSTWSQARRFNGGYVWAKLFALPRKNKVWSLVKQRGGKVFIEAIDRRRDTWVQSSIVLLGEPCQIMFADESRGWILERWNENSWIDASPQVRRTTTVLHHSENGGITWKVICKKECSGVKLILTGVNTLLMVAEHDIFMSEDGGLSWHEVLRNIKVPLLDMHFRGLIGAAVGTRDIIRTNSDVLLLGSNDGGLTWQSKDMPCVDSFFRVRMTTWSSGVLASDQAIYSFDLDT